MPNNIDERIMYDGLLLRRYTDAKGIEASSTELVDMCLVRENQRRELDGQGPTLQDPQVRTAVAEELANLITKLS